MRLNLRTGLESLHSQKSEFLRNDLSRRARSEARDEKNSNQDAYQVSLSKSYDSPTQQSASLVLAANSNRKDSQPIPPSLTSRLQKPKSNFDEFIEETFKDIESLRDVHQHFDRSGLIYLLE